MRYNSLEKVLIDKIKPALLDVTPGVVVRSYHFGRMICDINVGETYPLYDLASLTKIIFTQQAMMLAYDQNLWSLKNKVCDFLPDFNFKEMTITSLLTHTSKLEWWLPFYKDLMNESNHLLKWNQKRDLLFKMINTSKLNLDHQKAVYSDLGFMVLGFILEKIYNKDLHTIWLDLKNQFYQHSTLDFNLENKPLTHPKFYAPTEECPYRKKVLRGEVHDDNTWALGGISTHAGLFGSIDDVSQYGLNMRSQLLGIAQYRIKQKTAHFFSERALGMDVGDWAMGYMMPSIENPSCGSFFSKSSIGHTGFTGTSLWYDPKYDLLIIILSNRVHYGRENKAFAALRPQIHNWIFETLKRTI